MKTNELERLFNEVPQTMDIYSRKGDKVRYSFPDNGRDHEQKHTKGKLKLGEVYTVEGTMVFPSHTKVVLQEFPTESFNSVLFEGLGDL